MSQFENASRTNAFFVDPKELVIIGLDTGHKSTEEHPLYDERIHLPLDENMVRNVLTYGVLEAVIVRGKEVVAGRQRVRWARAANEILKAAGKEEIRVPVMGRKGDDASMVGILISENEIRTQDNPMVQARKILQFMAMGRTEQDAAIAFGVSKATIVQRLKLTELDAKVQDKVEAGKLPAYEALGLTKMPKEKQAEAAEVKVTARAKGDKKTKVEGDKSRVLRITKREIRALAQVMGGAAQMALLWSIGEVPEEAAMEDKTFRNALIQARGGKKK